jgi:hypothetical protein
MSETPREGAADAARGLSDNTRVLVRHEIAAAQRELLDKARHALPTIGLLGAAGFFGVLSASAAYRLSVRLLEKSLPPATAALVAAVGYGVAAGAAGAAGVQRLRSNGPLVQADTVREAVASVTSTAKAVAESATRTADTAKAVAGAGARKAADTAKATASTTAEKAADTDEKAAGARPRAATTSRTRRQAPKQQGTESS